MQKAPATAHRGSCDLTIPQPGPSVAMTTRPCCATATSASVRRMDPLLVITNSDAGTADEESLDLALAVLREHVSVEVQATGDPGELDGVLHRAGSRRIVVAGGDGSLHAVISALHRRNDLKNSVLGLLPLGTGNDFARGTDIPLDIEEAARVILHGEVRPDGPRGRRGRRGRRQQRARRRRGQREPPRRPLEGAARLGRGRQGQPRQARLPDRRGADRLETAHPAAAGRGRRAGGQRLRPAGPDGGRRQRLLGRRRRRAHPGRQPRGRPRRRDDLAGGRPAGAGPVRRAPRPRAAPRAGGRHLPARLVGVGDGRGVLGQRRRRDLRPGAPAHLARGARGVLDGAAPRRW